MAFDTLNITGKGVKTKHRDEKFSITDEIKFMVNRWNELETIRKIRPLTNYEKRKYRELVSNIQFQNYLRNTNETRI